MTRDIPKILLVNPWIHDFAAYDFWANPLGLLTLGGILCQHGFDVRYIDCLNRFHPSSSKPLSAENAVDRRYGRGPYGKTRIEKPAGLDDVARNFSRYGIEPEWFDADLADMPRPDIILVTSLMTYWYTGVSETISHLRKAFPQTPLLLGGIYATLCEQHARAEIDADRIVPGAGEAQLLSLMADLTGYSVRPKFDPQDLDSFPYPCFNLQTKIPYAVLMTSRGCPFSCAYCASKVLHPKRMTRSAESLVEEITYWHHKHGVIDFALYDDAFLIQSTSHAIPFLEAIVRSGLSIRFHTPNALHIREITQDIAVLMAKAGFTSIRLGLETASFDHRTKLDSKVTAQEFVRAVKNLKTAGFSKDQIGAYLLVGLPFQDNGKILESINIVDQAGLTPIPAYYSPIPGTPLWPLAVKSSRYDLSSDPIFTNNAIFPCQKTPFSWNRITELKTLIRK